MAWRHSRVHPHEVVGQEQLARDVVAVASESPEADTGKRRQEHGEVELLLAQRPVKGLVVHAVLVHVADVRAGDPVDAALGEQGLGEQVARHDVAAAAQLCIPPMPKSPSSYSLVIQMISALSRTLRVRNSNSRFTAYSKAAPSQVQVP